MALVLAIESDTRQAGILKRMIRDRVPADLVVSDSKDSAVASIAERLPDLILVSALMSPREEAELTEHLRGLEDADHLQTLTIPLLASKPARRAAGNKMLRALKWRRALALEGCDPSVFADEVRGYLERARELRAQRTLQRRAEEEAAIVRAEETAAAGAVTEPPVMEQLLIDPVAVSVDICEPAAECRGAPATPTPTDAAEIPESAVQPADEVELDRQEVPLAIDPPLAPMTGSDAVVSGQRQEPPAPDVVLQPVAPEQSTATVAPPGTDVPNAIELRQPLLESAEQEARDELSEWLKQDCKWIASAIDALLQDSRRARAERAVSLPTPAAAPDCASPPVEQVPVEEQEPAAPPMTAASNKRALRLVKTERRHLAKRSSPEPVRPAPVEDEWGIHDPRECGFGALMARLNAAAPGDRAAEEEETASPASLPRSRGARVTPLAIWAHAEADESGTDAEQDDLRGLFACLTLPAGIAAVSYPTGCRIRHVRVAPRAHARSGTALEKRTIILSRKLLRRLQRRDEVSRTQAPA